MVFSERLSALARAWLYRNSILTPDQHDRICAECIKEECSTSDILDSSGIPITQSIDTLEALRIGSCDVLYRSDHSGRSVRFILGENSSIFARVRDSCKRL